MLRSAIKHLSKRSSPSLLSLTTKKTTNSTLATKTCRFSTSATSKPTSTSSHLTTASSQHTPLQLTGSTPRGKYIAPIPVLTAWSFSNSPTFEADLEKQLKEAEAKNQPPEQPVPEKIYSSQDGLQVESFGSWIRAVLAQTGHFGLTELPSDDIAEYNANHDEIDFELQRTGIVPDSFLWCKHHLDKIFRFSSEDALGAAYSVKVPTTPDVEKIANFPTTDAFYDELIAYKTFVEKERYKYFRAYEEVLEMEANLGTSLDQLNVMLAHANPYDADGNRWESEILAPIYKSVYDSLISVAEMSSVLDKPLLVMTHHDRAVQKVFAQFEEFQAGLPSDKSVWREDQQKEFDVHQKGAYSKALFILRQQAVAILHAGQLITGMQQLMDEVSWQFKSYYDPMTFERIIGYAKEETNTNTEQRDTFFSNINKLPIPPLLNLSATSLLDHFVAVPKLPELAEKLKQESTTPADFDSEHISLHSPPLQLLLLLVDANDKTKRLTPSVHDRAVVFETANEMCETLRQRPYVLWGIHQRLLAAKNNPTTKHEAITDLHQFYQQPGEYSKRKKHHRNKKRRKRSPRHHPKPEDTHLLEDHSESPVAIQNHMEEVLHPVPAVLLESHPHVHDLHDDI